MVSVSGYVRFVTIGAFVGVVTVACRELIAHALGLDTRLNYSLSVALAYAIGIVLSYVLNGRWTFKSGARSWHWKAFALFILIAVLSLVSTWALSIALRYGLPLERVVGKYWPALAFASAAFLSSLLAYPLNAVFVFRVRSRCDPARRMVNEGEPVSGS
jgi:putative flippase GtrA